MLINLDATNEELANENPQEIEMLFSELLRASLIGSHMFLINRRICDWAIENLSCNNRELAQLNRLKELFAQRGSLLSAARSFLEVSIGDSHLTENETHKYRIGHRRLLEGNYLDTSRLLVEHIENDGDFLEIILNEIRRTHPIRNFKLERLHGGGSDIVSCLRTEIPNRRIVVSVVDSDKVAPCDTPSTTKRNLDREALRQTFTGMVCETPCKESENYIPLTVLMANRDRICPDYNSFDVIDSLYTRQSISGPSDCIWLYFDIKRGIESNRLDSISNPDVVSWLQEKFQLNGQNFNNIDINGFGDNILRQFLNCGVAVKEFIIFMNTSYWEVHFREFFDLIYWYFASEKKVRLI